MMKKSNLWVAPLAIAALVAAVGWWANREVRRAIQQELKQDLQSTLEANVTALEIWMANQKRIASALAEEPRFRALAVEILEQAEPTGTNRASLAVMSRQLTVGERLQERLRTLGYGIGQIVNTNLIVVAETSRGRGRTGSSVMEELQAKYTELFASGEPILITPFKLRPSGFGRRGGGGRGFADRPRPADGDSRRAPRPPADMEPGAPAPTSPPRRGTPPPRDFTVMQVAAPIKDTNGITQGALALIINPDDEFTRILSVARSGDSGETFAFDPDGVMISKSRFEDELKRLGLLGNQPDATSALTLSLRDPGGDLTQGFKLNTNAAQPLIQMVTNALTGASGVTMEPFRDYRGVPAIGAWRWLPDYGFGVGTKIDAREAFLPLRVVRGVFLILFLLLVLASLVILLFSYRQVVWRRRLTEAELKARKLGQYTLQEKIGEGGMGIVYKAHHALLRRETALKLLPPHKTNPSSVERFEREVQLTCRLTHPNTIQVYDYGHTPDGIFYYAMEYLDGLNLGQLAELYGPQPDERVVHILLRVCESLREAHGLGLIHRDIKPANVFLCDRGGVADSVKVLDFGLVKYFGDTRGKGPNAYGTEGEGIVGTPNFIAPEALLKPSQSDERSDLYSLGALGYYLLTGQLLFDGESFAEVCNKHLHEAPIPPGIRAGRQICPELEGLILRCLEKEPASRPQSAGQLAELLAACPCAGQWTPERRAAWWAGHRTKVAQLAPTPRRPVSAQATVNIEFADRTV